MESLILFPFPVSRSLRGLQGLLCDAEQHEAVDDTGSCGHIRIYRCMLSSYGRYLHPGFNQGIGAQYFGTYI